MINPVFNDRCTTLVVNCSNQFVPYADVCFQSVLEHISPNHFYDIIVLSSTLTDASKKYLEFKYTKSNHKPCYFTLGDLCRALGLSDQNKNRQKMSDSLIQLALNGLIEFRVVRYGRTYLRQLVDIRTEFIVIDTCQEIIESKTSGTKEFEGNTETIELDPELAETVMSIGLSQDKVNELKSGQEILQLMEPETVIVEMSNKEVKKKPKSSGRMWNI